MEELIVYIFTGLFGLCIGSFLSVCVYRIPRSRSDFADLEREALELRSDAEISSLEGLSTQDTSVGSTQATGEQAPLFSFNHPRYSVCPECRTPLRWWQNIPVLSWLLLGGRCAYCKTRISIRYPLLELFSAMSALLCLGFYDLTPTGVLVYLASMAVLVTAVIDLDYFIIPDVITIPGTVLGILIGVLQHFFLIFDEPVVLSPYDSFIGILAGAGFLWAVSALYLKLRKRDGLGLGDVKLLAMLGALFGPICALFTIFVGSVVGSVLGIGAVLIKGRRMNQYMPFGPFLAAGALLYLLRVPEFVMLLIEYYGTN